MTRAILVTTSRNFVANFLYSTLVMRQVSRRPSEMEAYTCAVVRKLRLAAGADTAGNFPVPGGTVTPCGRRARPAVIGPFRMTTRHPGRIFGRLWSSRTMGRRWSGRIDSLGRRPPSSKNWDKRRVWTLSTLFVSDCFVKPSNCPGCRRFS